MQEIHARVARVTFLLIGIVLVLGVSLSTWAGKAVANLPEGTKITVVGKEGDWLRVQPKNPENPLGYVWKDHAVAQ